MIDVSIIIPVYNVETYIGECLASVMAQTVSCAMECIVVDDCGTDRSMDIAHECIAAYSGPIDFKVAVRERNGGLSAARNTGIRQARGRYVYLLDSDDLITPDCIALLMECAARYPSAEIVTGDFQTFPDPDVHKAISLQGKNFPAFSDNVVWIRSIFLSKFPVTVWNKLISRRFISANNLYFKEGIIHEDNHWHAQAYHAVGVIAFVPTVTYLYRMRAGSITSDANAARKRLENYALIYTEQYGKAVKWDRPWAEWVRQGMMSLKYSPKFDPERQHALEHFIKLSRIVMLNRKAPILMRLLFCYWGMRCHRGQEKIVIKLFDWYWKAK